MFKASFSIKYHFRIPVLLTLGSIYLRDEFYYSCLKNEIDGQVYFIGGSILEIIFTRPYNLKIDQRPIKKKARRVKIPSGLASPRIEISGRADTSNQTSV